MIQYICKYTPIELFAGFGVKCARREPKVESFELADGAAHQNLCGFGRALLEDCLRNGTGELVLVNCCDSIRRVYDVLQQRGDSPFLYLLDLPRCETACSRKRFAQALQQLSEAYAAYSGLRFSYKRFCAAFSSAAPSPDAPYLSLLGARASESLLGAVQASSSLPVQNDTCTGRRDVFLPSQALPEEAFWEAYAAALLGQTPCMRMTNPSGRRRITESPYLGGVIYHTVKFCDYYDYEYSVLKQGRLPITKIETDYTPPAPGQLETRIEAFLETLPEAKPQKPQEGSAKMDQNAIFAGIDSGSTSTNAVLLSADKHILAYCVVPTGARAGESAHRALNAALQKAGRRREEIARTVTTGYGRAHIGEGDQGVTEITCHAKGAFFLNPQVRTVIDIGGQDSKVIRLDDAGRVTDFVMNDKCAAGTGRFLDMMARTLEMDVSHMGEVDRGWKEEITISSICTVFAESEVVSLIAQNKRTADIVHGLHKSVASKIGALLARVKAAGAYMMTGGVAKNEGVRRAIEEKTGEPLLLSEEPQICGALGAALLALESWAKA